MSVNVWTSPLCVCVCACVQLSGEKVNKLSLVDLVTS